MYRARGGGIWIWTGSNRLGGKEKKIEWRLDGLYRLLGGRDGSFCMHDWRERLDVEKMIFSRILYNGESGVHLRSGVAFSSLTENLLVEFESIGLECRVYIGVHD